MWPPSEIRAHQFTLNGHHDDDDDDYDHYGDEYDHDDDDDDDDNLADADWELANAITWMRPPSEISAHQFTLNDHDGDDYDDDYDDD